VSLTGRHGPTETAQRAEGRAIDLFQLALLEVASARLPIAEFVVKGGANLRFFHRSVRRSRDIDFDHTGARFERFADRVDEMLGGSALRAILRARALELADVRRTKQTATTRRWKFTLVAPGVARAASKIEFSARGRSADHDVAPVDHDLARRLGGRAARVARYGPVASIEQKIGALALRGEIQARDVFDLDHLFRLYPDALDDTRAERRTIQVAIARALELSYDEYRGTVVDYLEEDVADVLGTEDAWSGMVLAVTERLEGMLGEEHRG
jgi:hypothetical protein